MCWDYLDKGTLTILMKHYIDNIIDEFPEVIERTASSLVVDSLFQIRDNSEASKRQSLFNMLLHSCFFSVEKLCKTFKPQFRF